MGKLKYYVASSIDGFIARKDSSFSDFVFEGEVVNDYINSLFFRTNNIFYLR